MPAGDLTTLAALKTYLALPATWTISTAFSIGDNCRANGNLYVCITAGTSAGSGTGPSGTGTDITDGGVHWKYLGPNLTTDDATLSRVISSCSSFFSSICDRTFLSASYTLTASGHGTTSLALPESPVTAVSSVSIDGSVIPARAGVGGFGWVQVGDKIMLDGGYVFTRGIANISVAYTAGYSAVPYDLEQACIETCASWYKRRARTDEESKSIQGETVSFSMDVVPESARGILQLYQRPWPR